MHQLPFQVDDPLGLPPKYRELQTTHPLTRVLTSMGDPAWLATGYEVVKTLAENRALGRSHPEPEAASKINDGALIGGPRGDHATEHEEHQRMRKLLAPAFSAKRMAALEETIGARVDAILDEMQSPPVDLHAVLSAPLPVMVICELLGAPYEDYERFRTWSSTMASLGDTEAAFGARAEFTAYAAERLEEKRRAPAEDVFTDLAQANEGRGMPAEEAARLAQGLLFAGHETTMTRIDLGTLLLLRNPEQRDKLIVDPSLAKGAAEEILRMTTSAGVATAELARYAAEDVTVGSTTIPAGDAVLLGFGAANRDPAVFDHPDELDINRSPNPHLGFGFGAHYCIGNSLARIELRAVFSRLFQRFPDLRLAVPEHELQFLTDKITGGVSALPVTW